MLCANRSGVAVGQVGLTSIAEDKLAGQLGSVRVFGVLVDDGGVTRDHGAIGRDQHYIIIRIGHLGFVAQAIEVPNNADFDFTFFHGGDGWVGQRNAPLLGQIGKHQQRRLNVRLIAAVGNRRCQHAVGGLCGGAHIADGDLVFARLQVRPFSGDFRTAQQLFIDDKGNGAGVSQCPVAVLVLGPFGDLIPSRRFVRLSHPLGHRYRAERSADVTDIGAGVIFLGCELGHLLSRAHVGVHVFEAVIFFKISPGRFPVGPVIGHADTVHCTFSFSRSF